MRTIVLECDEDDWNTIQDEIARQQLQRDTLPEGTSNLAGAYIAEAIRSLEEYRALYEEENPLS